MRSIAVAAAAALVLGVVPIVAVPAAAFEPLAGPYAYVQPDAAGDVFPHASASWGDITALSFHTLPNGTLLVQMKFVDLARATGDMRYCFFFSVGGTTYQSGARGQFANGAATSAITRCSWSNSGTSVGSVGGVFFAADQIHVYIEAQSIGNPEFGTPIKGINAKIGVIVPGAGQGDQSIFDTLTPSVQPIDFAYGAGAPPPAPLTESFLFDAESNEASAAAGASAAYVVKITNNGTGPADFNLSAEGLPDGFAVAFSPENGSIEAGLQQKADVSVLVPDSAPVSTLEFSVRVIGPLGGNATVDLVLHVLAPDAAGPSQPSASPGAATNGTEPDAAPQSGDGGTPGPAAALVVAVLAVAALVARRRSG